MTFKKLLIGSACLLASMTIHAQNFPTRAVNLSVPYGAGGSSDGIARKFAKLLEDELKQSVVILNQPGASGTLQLGNLARAKPDGYTMGLYSYSAVTFTSQLMKVPYKRDDFEVLGGMAEFSYGIVAHPDSPINSVKDMVAQAKTPKGVFFGVTGAPNNFPFLQLQSMTGGQFDQVTYKSSAESVNSVIGKQVDVALQGPSEYAELVRAGKLKFIASASAFRLPWFPDRPTLKEEGYDISIAGILGVAVPKGVPADIKATLESAVRKVASSKEYNDFLVEQYGIKGYPASAAEFSKLIDEGVVKMRKMIDEHNIKM